MNDPLAIVAAVAKHLEATEDADGRKLFSAVDQLTPKSVGALPRAVVHYRQSPQVEGPGRLKVIHMLEVEAVIAPYADVEAARRVAGAVFKTVSDQLRKQAADGSGGVCLAQFDGVTNVVLSVEGQRFDEARYGGTRYLTAVLTVIVTEITAQDYS